MGYWRSIDSALSATRGQTRHAITLARRSVRGPVLAVVTGGSEVGKDGYARGCVVVTDTTIVSSFAADGWSALVVDRFMPHPVTVTSFDDEGDDDDLVAVDIAGLPTLWCSLSEGEALRGLLSGQWPLQTPTVGAAADDVAESGRRMAVGAAIALVVIVGMAVVAFTIMTGARIAGL